jgi:Zn-finger protein
VKNSHRYFENRGCKYYPCHQGLEHLNCLFCFCPLYTHLNCGGNYAILKNGIKSCQNCTRPHIPENYDVIIKQLSENNNT